ncbi:MAG: tetratricopeptide repeat protein [Bacteroidota bacterium]
MNIRYYLFVWFSCYHLLAQGQQLADSLLQATQNYPQQATETYLRLAQLNSNNPARAIEYSNQAVDAALSPIQKTKALHFLGNLYFRTGNSSKALQAYKSELEQAQTADLPKQEAEAKSALGAVYFITGNLSESLNQYLQALRYYESSNDKSNILSVYSGLASIYLKQNNFSKSLEYNLKAVQVYEQSANKFKTLMGYDQIGNLYLLQKDYVKANDYLNKSLKLYKELNNRAGEASILIQLGNIQQQSGNTDKAISYYRNSLQLSKELKMLPLQASALNALAVSYETNKLYEYAIDAAKQAKEIAQASNLKIELELSYDILSRLYKKKSDPEKAITFQNLSKELKDSLYNDSTLKQLADLQLRYESEKKQQQLELQQKEQELLEIELTNERITRKRFIYFSIILTIGLIVVFYFYNQNRKFAKHLQQQKVELEKTTEEIIKQKEELGQLNQIKDRFFSIISHDLRNSLTTMKLYFDLISNKTYKPETNHEELTKQISSSVENTIDLLENLLVWAKAQIKGIDFNPKVLQVSDIVQKNVNLLNGSAHQKNIRLENITDEDLYVFADEDMFHLVVRNLLANAIKFTNTGGNVTIHTEENPTHVTVHVTDSGVGIGKESLEKLFTKTQNPSTLGTGNEKGTGLGLMLCKEFVLKNNGQIHVESIQGQGSTFSVSLPKPI